MPALAPWRLRLVAALLDGAVLFLLSSLLLVVIGERPLWASEHHHAVNHVSVARHGTALLAALLYYPPAMWASDGQTLGKFAMGIRVVRTDARPMSLTRAAWREVVIKVGLFDAISLAPVIGALGTLAVLLDSLWPLWDRENRALHDMLAATRVRVLRRRGRAGPQPEPASPSPEPNSL